MKGLVCSNNMDRNMHKRGNVKKSLKQEESKFKVDPWLMGFLLFVVFGSTVFGMFMIPKLQ